MAPPMAEMDIKSSVSRAQRELSPARTVPIESWAKREPSPARTVPSESRAQRDQTSARKVPSESQAQREPSPARAGSSENRAQREPSPARTVSSGSCTQREPRPARTEPSENQAQRELNPARTKPSENRVQREPNPARIKPSENRHPSDADLASALSKVLRRREQLISTAGLPHAVHKYKEMLTTELNIFVLDGGWTQVLWLEEEKCGCGALDTQATFDRIHLSGSVREGTEVHVSKVTDLLSLWPLIKDNYDFLIAKFEPASDIDLMLELGPVSVFNESEPSPSARSASALLAHEPAPSPGFVNLYHRRGAECRHEERRAFSGFLVNRFMEAFSKRLCASHPDVKEVCAAQTSRPATGIAISGQHVDLVPCVSCPIWPREQFRTRLRPSGFPSAELVDRLCRTPIFLVPAFGTSHDDATREHNWRMSFSRHEQLLLRSLGKAQKACLMMLKHCNAIMGCQVPSHHLKTALLWVCELAGPDLWTWKGMLNSMVTVLDFLESWLAKGALPCYFLPSINLVDFSSDKAHVKNLRTRLTTALMVMCAGLLNSTKSQLMRSLLGCHMTGGDLLKAALSADTPQDLLMKKFYSALVERPLWSDSFLRSFKWKTLPSRCQGPDWLSEHDLDKDSSDCEDPGDDG